MKKNKRHVLDTLNPAEVIRYYQSGKTLRECGNQFGVSYVTIKNLLTVNGIPLRSRSAAQRLRKERERKERERKQNRTKERVISLYESGVSIEACCRETSTSQPRIRKILQEAGIEIRDPSFYLKRKSRSLPAQEIKRLYLEDQVSGIAISEKYNVSPPTIYKVLRRQGVKLRSGPEAIRIAKKMSFEKRMAKKDASRSLQTTDAQIEVEIVRLRTEDNARIQDIAHALEIETPRVYSVLQNAGVS